MRTRTHNCAVAHFACMVVHFPPCTQTVSALTFRRDLHAGLRTYVVFARIFPLLVARHHNVDNLGSLAWSSPRHLAAAASLLFFDASYILVFTNEFVRLFVSRPGSADFRPAKDNILRVRTRNILSLVHGPAKFA